LIPIVIANIVPNTTAITGRLSPIIPTTSALIPVTAVLIAVRTEASKNVGTYGVGYLKLILTYYYDLYDSKRIFKIIMFYH